ncbi:MAG: ABC transporter substrate-binding protein [Sandaracinus sp.]|nr:ABC transporter substrate-binding protein [Sandaracinus sp.]
MNRRHERLGCAVFALLGAAATLAFAFSLPEPPPAPRWDGARNETPRNGGTFVFHHEANVRSLDPHIAYDELSGMAIRLVFDGLLDYDHQSELVPSLADAMPTVSEDGRTFRFRLRRGVRFHAMPFLPGDAHPEGRELVAEDVRWSMLRLLSEEVGSPGYPFYASIQGADEYHTGQAEDVSGIRVIDRYTIEFELKEADQTFLNALAMPFAYPVPRENYEHWEEAVKFHPVGTGPYVFEMWERGVQLSFTRNTHYWREKVGPDRMLYLENIARELAAQRFRNGDIDSIHRQSPSDYRFFKESEAWAPYMVEEPRGSTYGIGLNCEMPPFDDVHVRRAIAFALDREGWSRARAGRLLPAGQVLPPSIPGYDPELPTRQYFDLDRAREEMRLAGHPDGLRQPITVWITGQDDTSRQYGELLQADLARIGIEVRLRFVSFAVYLTESGKPNTVPAFFTGWNLDFPDPSNFLFLFDQASIHPEHSENRVFYRNPEVDRLLAEGKSERDRDRRLGLYRQANEIVARDAPWAFLYYATTMELWQPYVRNYDPHPVWSEDYRDVWLDLPRRRVARSLAGVGGPVPARFYPMGGLR